MPDPGIKRAAQAALVEQLRHAHRLHAQKAGNPILAGALDRLADWQSRRLLQTYADLAEHPRYADAIAFFRTDLYGGDELAQRDADLAKVVPVMVRVLPASAIETLAEAMELSVLSMELDRVLLEQLPRANGPFTVVEYCRAYRRAGNIPQRRRQIALIGSVGRSLDMLVHKPLVRSALAMMRKPARVAGFGSLQSFLERGFEAFRHMGGAKAFLDRIETRELEILEAIVAGATDPFPDPVNRLGLGGTRD